MNIIMGLFTLIGMLVVGLGIATPLGVLGLVFVESNVLPWLEKKIKSMEYIEVGFAIGGSTLLAATLMLFGVVHIFQMIAGV